MSHIFTCVVFFFLALLNGHVNCAENAYQFTNREELVIDNVTSYDHFKLGRDVLKWESVTVEGKNYAVGLMAVGICIFTAEMDSTGVVVFKNMTDTSHRFRDVELLKYWNSTSKTYEVVVLLLSESLLLQWYKVSSHLTLVKIWVWRLHKEITHTNAFEIDGTHYLLVLKNQSYFIADLYRFTLNKNGKHFWLYQTISLSHIARSSTLNTYQSKNYLSIPQDHAVHVLKYTNDRFVPFTNLPSPNVDTVKSFNIGIKSYLLINGHNAGIYEFNNNALIKRDIENVNLDNVNFWLPMQLTTYREEAILLGQRVLDNDSHNSKKIELILSSGNKFSVHEEIPCNYYGEVLNGIDCLVEEENHNISMNGSAVLYFDRLLGIVIPKKEMPSGLFLLHVDTKQVRSPIEKQMDEIRSLRNEIEEMMEKRRNSINTIRERINTFASPISEHSKQNESFSIDGVDDTSQNLTRQNEMDRLDDLQFKVDAIKNYLDNIKERLKSAVRKDSRRINLENLVLKNIIEVQGNSRITELTVDKINDVDANTAFSNFVRIGDKKSITGKKTIAKLDVERIDTNTINGQNVNNMYFKKQSGAIKLKGDLMIEEPLEVKENVITTSGKINDEIDLVDVVTVGETVEEKFQFENITVKTIQANIVNGLPIHSNNSENLYRNSNEVDDEYDTFYVPGNVTVGLINGENFQEILKNTCMKNLDKVIPGKTIIDGNVSIINNIEIEYLNGLKFPEEYIFDDTENYIIISGNKYFADEITAGELTTSGNVNGINTSTVVNLSKNQTIPGLFIFNDLDVIVSLNNTGTITGVPNFQPNPTILETNVLKSDLSFEVLEIDGMLTIGNRLNETNLEQFLEDVLLKNEKDPVITSIKDFTHALTIVGNLDIESNSINGIPLDSFVDKTSEQTLNINVLNGNVTFENLFVVGLFGGVNITKLNEETVKLTGNQFISSNLTFFDDVNVKNLTITEALNDVLPDAYISVNGDRFLPFVDSLGEVEVDYLTVEGNYNGGIGNLDMEDFNKKRISLTRDQEIHATYYVTTLYLDNLNAIEINNYTYSDLFDSNRYKTLLVNRILDNKIKIKDLEIVGSLTVESINDVSMGEIMKTCIYQGENKLASNIAFRDNVEFTRIKIHNMNGIPFSDIVANLVFKNETNVVFEEPKFFQEGLLVRKFIDVESINEIPIEDILRKTGDQKISGPLVIEGDVTINGGIIKGNLNEVPMQYVAEVFEVVDEDTYKINGEVLFDQNAYVDNLRVHGFLNEKNISRFFDEIVSINDDAVIPGVTTFTEKVRVDGNLDVMEHINDIDLSKFAEDVVLTTEDTYIEGLVSFSQPVQINKILVAESDLWCESVMGIDVGKWGEKAMFINEGKIEGELHFESVTISGSIKTDFINNINMSTLVPLRTEQHIPEGLFVQEMSAYQEIKVDNLVNGIKLEPEFSNTLLNDGHQEIFSDIDFIDNVVVHEDLTTNGLVNSTISLDKVVTLNTDQNLTASYNFSEEIRLYSNLTLEGLINDINVSRWQAEGVKKQSDRVQIMRSPLHVEKDVTFENNVKGNTISGLDVRNMADEVERNKLFKAIEEKELRDDYGKICHDVDHLLNRAKSQIYKFKYLDHLQSIYFDYDIGTVHHFEHEYIHYILVNEKNSCKSHLFSWSPPEFSLINDEIETGMVSQFITVRYENNSLYLVGRGDSYATRCSIEGTNIWKFEDVNEILHTHKLENLLLLQVSKIPGTFYGFNSEFAFEFNVRSYFESSPTVVRKWEMKNSVDNLAYMPHNLKTGLALRDGHKVIKLLKEKPLSNAHHYNINEVVMEEVVEELNYFIPGRRDGDFVVLNVGSWNAKTMTAVATHEETSVKGKLDFIKIYDDIFNGKLFHKILTYKPSSLISMEFDKNGETLLVFLEDEKILQVYEYKGIEGFKLHSSIKEKGQKLMLMKLPLPPQNKLRNILAIINHNGIKLLEAVMDGNSIDEEYLQCTL